MTATAFEEARRAAPEAGMDAHVAGPVGVEELLNVIACILQGSREGK